VSVYGIMAVSCVALTNVVLAKESGEPFQLIMEPFTKFVPVTVSVKLDVLQ